MTETRGGGGAAKSAPILVGLACVIGCALVIGWIWTRPDAGGNGTPSESTPGSSGERRARWIPRRGLTWQWQLSGTVDLNVDADVFDLDGFETGRATVDELHRRGRRAICYLDVGAVESYRPDARAFPDRVIGRPVDGWSHERYLDIRMLDVIGPILARRLDLCASKGFDGVEGDLVDAYANSSGFPITARDEVRFIRWFVAEAHARGLAAGLKNDTDLVPELVDQVDFAIVEDCHHEGTCAAYAPLLRRNKPVFDAEYISAPDAFCAPTRALGIEAIAKEVDLGAHRVACPDPSE